MVIWLVLSNTWWRHPMDTFSALLAICAGNSPVPGEFSAQRPVTRSFDVFFDLRLNKRLSKQWWGWWFETLSRPLWRHCHERIQVFSENTTKLNKPLSIFHGIYYTLISDLRHCYRKSTKEWNSSLCSKQNIWYAYNASREVTNWNLAWRHFYSFCLEMTKHSITRQI